MTSVTLFYSLKVHDWCNGHENIAYQYKAVGLGIASIEIKNLSNEQTMFIALEYNDMIVMGQEYLIYND